MRTKNFWSIIVALAGFLHIASAASGNDWRGRAIYQLLTDRFARTDGSTTATCNTGDGNYCGGTWRGIIQQLDYIKNMGFTAIWISPVTYPIQSRTQYGYGWHGYWQQDLYRLNDRFGTADDLKALSKAVHDRGMYLMVDVVINHNGWVGEETGVQYSDFHPFNDEKYFHNYCPISNYSNQSMVETCWLGDNKVPLPDLKTEDSTVVNMYNTWIKQLVSNYSIDGLRLDTGKHVGMNFWQSFQQAAGVFTTAEIYSGDVNYACAYQGALNSVLNYPAYFPFMSFLGSTSGTTGPLLQAFNNIRNSCRDPSVLGTFIENHDVPRFASGTQDMALAKNAMALPILWDGIPIVYAGQEQHYAGYGDPANREATWLAQYSRQSPLYKVAAALNQLRNVVQSIDPGYATYGLWSPYSDQHTVALRKGNDGNQIVSVLTNTGSSTPSWTLNLQNTGWQQGTTVVEVLTCSTLTTGNGGSLAVPMSAGEPRVYFSKNQAQGKGICSGAKKSRGVRTTRAERIAAAAAGAVAAAAGADMV